MCDGGEVMWNSAGAPLSSFRTSTPAGIFGLPFSAPRHGRVARRVPDTPRRFACQTTRVTVTAGTVAPEMDMGTTRTRTANMTKPATATTCTGTVREGP
jgi:hypothetical protein